MTSWPSIPTLTISFTVIQFTFIFYLSWLVKFNESQWIEFVELHDYICDSPHELNLLYCMWSGMNHKIWIVNCENLTTSLIKLHRPICFLSIHLNDIITDLLAVNSSKWCYLKCICHKAISISWFLIQVTSFMNLIFRLGAIDLMLFW